MKRIKLIDSFCIDEQPKVKIEEKLFEGKNQEQTKGYVIKGPFARANVPNGNRRIYTTEELNKAIEKRRPFVKSNRVRMLLDHPDWFDGKLSKVAARLVDITDVQDDGWAYYEAEIIETSAGKDLKAILESGSKVGVSTRGTGYADEEEVPGYEGKFDVIRDYELESIDFVDNPAVADTETYMHTESKKRRTEMFKNVEEFKTAYPDLFKKIIEENKKEVEKSLKEEISTSKGEIDEAKKTIEEKTDALDGLIESIKKACPEKFTVVEESKVVLEKEKELLKVQKQLEAVTKEAEEIKAKMKEAEELYVKNERDVFVDHLKETDKDFFEFESFKNCFENCLTKDEVKTVYENNSKVLSELKEKVGTPAKSKVEQTKSGSETKDGMSEAQQKDMEIRNRQRIRSGLEPMEEARYLEMFGKSVK